ncbi:hypothetical protein DACRYDRAFT_105527 [Dacryopinax primogenitus]|uniref:Uncharacterized protein n=1 Tax=Dacryopinax primogenitus (strain DJM 731) TaxID=1858805 RepID=M5GFV3_DACPD|nr:uncharacterized protein DACRYDRAFT_105527 [Dacryopinax primogenitus]EJU04468.1 hypothetical protein DACRYDRAFT_105527 [Dacryopinax primogenitus]
MIHAQHLSSYQSRLSSPLKRKRDIADDVDNPHRGGLLPVDERPPPSKRAHSLEDGFSLMSLISPPTRTSLAPSASLPEPVEFRSPFQNVFAQCDSPPPVPNSATIEMDEDSFDGRPSANRTAEEVENGDIAMKRSTWYEKDKDRIVILDLDSDDEESPRSSPPPEYIISGALLSLLPVPVGDTPSPPGKGQLVLYRPPPWRDSEELENRSRNVDEQDVTPAQDALVTHSTDAMDIED